MTIPINVTLYRVLLRMGADEKEAEAAARVDASMLATKADLVELKGSLLMWLVTMLIAQTALILTVLRVLR